jgi:hypothetical protein
MAREEMETCQREIAQLGSTGVCGLLSINACKASTASATCAASSPLECVSCTTKSSNPVDPFIREDHEDKSRSNPSTPEVAQFSQNRLPTSAQAAFVGNFRDPYAQALPYPSSQPQRMPSTQATASILRDSSQQYRRAIPGPRIPTRHLVSVHRADQSPQSLTSLERPTVAHSCRFCTMGNMSLSFTANLLPQELFRSLEGDQTPSESKIDLEDPWDANQAQDREQEPEIRLSASARPTFRRKRTRQIPRLLLCDPWHPRGLPSRSCSPRVLTILRLV